MVDFWTHIQALEDETLHALVQNKPFGVIKVTDYACVNAVPAEDRTRPKLRVLYWADLTSLYEQLMKDGELSIGSIKEIYKFNSSYASLLVSTLTYSKKLSQVFWITSSTQSGGNFSPAYALSQEWYRASNTAMAR
jgi:hypothetical protein